MPNIKSAKKRVLVIEKKSLQNKMIRSSVKTEIKKIDTLIKEGKTTEARALLPEVFGAIDSAVSKGVLHRNNASNKKSRISEYGIILSYLYRFVNGQLVESDEKFL